MKSILIVSALFPPEPVVSAILSYDIANQLSELNNVIVVSPYPSRPNGLIFSNNFVPTNQVFKHQYLKSYISMNSGIISRMRESISWGISTYRFIIQNHKSIDCIYMNTWPMFAQLFTVISAKKYKIPIVTHIQDIYPESLTQKMNLFKNVINLFFLPIDKYILRNSKCIITISQSMRDYLIKTRNISSHNIKVAYNWQNENVFDTVFDSNEDVDETKIFTFMYLGTLSKLAMLDSLIMCFHKANLQDSQLVIVGDGSEKSRLVKLVNDLEVQNVFFKSANGQEASVLQMQSDVLILGLKPDASKLAFPSKIPAYMLSSRPIIAFVDDPSEISSTIVEANCGWVVNSNNPVALIEKFKEVRNIDYKLLREKGLNGRSYAVKNLSKKTNLEIITRSILNI